MRLCTGDRIKLHYERLALSRERNSSFSGPEVFISMSEISKISVPSRDNHLHASFSHVQHSHQ